MDANKLTPTTAETLDALTALGQGNTHEISARSGRSRSATDRALKQLADAGLITVVDTGADPAEGTPTRYTPTTTADGPTTEDTVDAPGADHHNNGDDTVEDADAGIGKTDDHDNEDQDDEVVDQNDDGNGDGNGDGEDGDEDEDEDDEDDDEDDDEREARKSDAAPTSAAPALPSRIPDRVVLLLAGILNAFPTGIDATTIVQISGKHPVTVKKILSAMEQAGAAIRTKPDPAKGNDKELWLLGETNPADVDPSPEPPRCPACQQVIRQGQNANPRSAGTGTPRQQGTTTNSDGSAKFGPGELRALVKAFINEHPGHELTVGTIQRELQVRLGRAISPGAVRNNCASLAAAGDCQLVTDEPYTVTANPAPATDSTPDGGSETDDDK
ncbi:MarR family transcriptional regulator [Catellatospora chokoriensis]|uniref:Transcription regulator TrmB N-terminal domain-containing protein n=1 Tax=Catellatospora chokoriensis TaxID=310353 RepID=A0A8J3NRR9_9ACTN|nr:helix-turn-helix domain-containing protein [Catellatospora chokoriensis]GIF89801.1 hypothetical protein Cch02nite_32450 [Catellatospora chokoriensis]